MDEKAILELLEYIEQSVTLIIKRFAQISCSDDFLKDDYGLEKLDAISMRLQSIGEAIKSIYKRDSAILLKVSGSDYWSRIIRLREIISHHYIDIDAEIIFDICRNELAEFLELIRKAKKTSR